MHQKAETQEKIMTFSELCMLVFKIYNRDCCLKKEKKGFLRLYEVGQNSKPEKSLALACEDNVSPC